MRADKRMSGWAVAVALLLSAYPLNRLSAQQQQQPTETVDRVAAIVGDRVILLSEVDEALQQMRAQGMPVPEDSAGLLAARREFLAQLIDDEVLFQRARQDTTITVTDQEVAQGVEEQVQQVRRQFRTEAEFRTALAGSPYGTIEEYRRFLTEQQRRSAYVTRYVQKQQQSGALRGGSVSDEDLRRNYQEMLAAPNHPRRQPSITVRQIVIAPLIRDSSRAVALAQAESVRVELERGADFATMARRFSDDGSREAGGDLGFFRRGMMVRPFEQMAFSLRPGVVSPVVTTQFGYHIIQVDRIQGAEVKARHILFSPDVLPADLAAARARADSLATLVRAGASADSLARVYGDTSEPRSLGPLDRSRLPPVYGEALAEATVGSVVGPVAAEPATPERTRFLVLQVADLQPERDYTFEEAKEELRTRLLRQQGIQNLVNDLRRRMYVDVRL